MKPLVMKSASVSPRASREKQLQIRIEFPSKLVKGFIHALLLTKFQEFDSSFRCCDR